MLKRIGVWGVVAIAVVLAVQVLLREGPPPSLVVPPSMKLPAVDDIRERELRQAAPAAAEGREDVTAAPATPDDSPAEADGSRRLIWDCGNGVLFAVRTGAREVTVFSPQALGGEVITLPQADAASGARYTEDGVSYWNKGGLATFELRERTFADCTTSSRDALSGARTAYRTFSGTQELNVAIDGIPCNDTMSGERFASTVTVTFENRTLYGCGQPP